MQQILISFAFISLALPMAFAETTDTETEAATEASTDVEEPVEATESSEEEQDLDFTGPIFSGLEPEVFAEEGDDYSFFVFSFGVGQRDSDSISSKFLEYRDIPQGAVAPFLRFQGKSDTFRYDLIGRDITQKDQRYHGLIEGAKWKVGLDYTGIPHRFGNGGKSILTPISETDGTEWRISDTLQGSLQSSVEATPSRDFESLLAIVQPTLDERPSDIDIRLQRNRMNLMFSLLPQGVRGDFNLDVTYFHERRTGSRTNNGTSFGFNNVVETAEPVRYITQDFGVKASMKGDWGVVFGGLNYNDFSDRFDTFGWDNPWRATDSTDPLAFFNPVNTTNGPKTGLYALPPSNEAWMVNGGTTLMFGRGTRVTADAQVGEWTQNDQSFIPFTTNDAIVTSSGQQAATAPLPATSLNGQIDVLALNGFFTSRLTNNVRLNARYRLYENDNQTPRLRFDEGYARFDTVWVATPRIPVPYGWKSNYFDVYGTVDAGRILGFELGYKWKEIEREFRETDRTSENTVRAAADLRFDGGFLLRGLFEVGNRDFDSYDAVGSQQFSFLAPGAPSNQTVLRRYDQAKRDRNRAGFQAQWTPASGIFSVGAAWFRNNEDYDDSPVPCAAAAPGDLGFCPGGEQVPLGLQESTYETYSIDLDVSPNELHTFYFFYSREDIFDFQTGRQSGATISFDPTTNWSSTIDSAVDSIGGGAELTLVEEVWLLDFFYRYQKVDASNALTAGSALRGPGNPVRDINAFDDTKLSFVSVQLKRWFGFEEWLLTIGGFFEDYEIDDLQNGSLANYMPGAFFLDPNNRDYQAWTAWANITYRFAP